MFTRSGEVAVLVDGKLVGSVSFFSSTESAGTDWRSGQIVVDDLARRWLFSSQPMLCELNVNEY